MLFISWLDRFTVFLCTRADDVEDTEESVSDSVDEEEDDDEDEEEETHFLLALLAVASDGIGFVTVVFLDVDPFCSGFFVATGVKLLFSFTFEVWLRLEVF